MAAVQERIGDEDALARLRASDELYARAFMINPVPMTITNVDSNKFTHINNAFAELVGYTRSDIIGRTSEQLGFWPDSSRRAEVGRRIERDDAMPLVRATIRRKGGAEIPVLVSFRLLALQAAPSVLSVLVPLP